MNTEQLQFRSKKERDSEVRLERNYRQIGIPALAAASHDCCKAKRREQRAAKESAITR